MFAEQFQSLLVGQVPESPIDAPLEVVGITAVHQHIPIVIGLQKNGMAVFKMGGHPFAGLPYIRENTYTDIVVADNETLRIMGIVALRECGNLQRPDVDGLVGDQVVMEGMVRV